MHFALTPKFLRPGFFSRARYWIVNQLVFKELAILRCLSKIPRTIANYLFFHRHSRVTGPWRVIPFASKLRSDASILPC